MKPYTFVTLGLAAIATSTALLTPPTAAYANSTNLSEAAVDLLELDASSASYSTAYDTVKGQYDSQAIDYSLTFDDWLMMTSFMNHERAAYGSDGAKLNALTALNPDDLTWEAGASVEVFFVNESAGYWNDFGYSLTTEPSMAPYTTASNPLNEFWNAEVTTIWTDLDSVNSLYTSGTNSGGMTLGAGHFIGDVGAGETVSFFLKNDTNNVFDAGTVGNTFNQDGQQHVTTYQYQDFLVLAYEDLNNLGDADYNDVMIAVRGSANISGNEVDVPEPTTVLALLGLGVVGSTIKRQKSA